MSYRKNLIHTGLLLLLCTASYSVQAQPKEPLDSLDMAVPAASMDTVSGTAPEPVTAPNPLATKQMADEIATINERLALMSAQLAELDLKAKIVQKVAEIQKIESDGPDAKGPGASPSPAPISEPVKLWPTIRDVSGIDGKLRATLIMGNGKTRTIQAGDDVQGWTVKSIKVSGVTLVKGERETQLDFTYAAAPAQNTADGAAIGMGPTSM